jgi:hypothetical protein
MKNAHDSAHTTEAMGTGGETGTSTIWCHLKTPEEHGPYQERAWLGHLKGLATGSPPTLRWLTGNSPPGPREK